MNFSVFTLLLVIEAVIVAAVSDTVIVPSVLIGTALLNEALKAWATGSSE